MIRQGQAPVVISKSQYAVFVKDFFSMDARQDGALDESDAAELLTMQLELTPSSSQLQGFMAGVNRNAEGKIAFHDYLCMIVGPNWVVEGHLNTSYRSGLNEEEIETISKVVGTAKMAAVLTEDLAEALLHHFTKAGDSEGKLKKTDLQALLSQSFSISEEKIETIITQVDAEDPAEDEVDCEALLIITLRALGGPAPPPDTSPPSPPKWRVIPSADEVGAPPPSSEGPA